MIGMGNKSNMKHVLMLLATAAILFGIFWFSPEETSTLYIIILTVIIILLVFGSIYLLIPERKPLSAAEKDSLDDSGYEAYLQNLPDLPPLSGQTAGLENFVDKLDDTTVQKLLRDTPPEDIAIALSGASGRITSRFLENMGSRGKLMLVDDIIAIRNSATTEDIREKQQNLINQINQYGGQE